MEDINPGFVPRALKTIPMNFASTSVARPDKGKGKAKELPSEKPSNAGLMKFFSPRMVQGREAPATTEAPSAAGPGRPAGAASTMAVGKKSGKRTLAEVMEEDMAAKRSRQEAALVASAAATATPRMPTTSKFFHGPQRSVSDPRGGRGWSRTVALATAGSPASQPQQPVAGSSGLLRCEKENVPCQEDACPEAVAGEEDVDLDVCMREPDAVVQEDGYVSPTESIAQWDSPDLSSPLRPGASKRRRSDGGGGDDWDEIDDADVLSSSPVAHTRTRKLPTMERERFVTIPRALPLRPVVNTSFSSRARRKSLGSKHGAVDDSINSADGSEDEAGRGPDLQNVFDDWDWDEITSGGEDDEDCEIEDKDVIDRTASSTPRPITLATEDGERCLLEESNSEELEDDMASAAAAAAEAARNATVANGWWEKWARSGASTSAGGNRNHSDHDRIRVRVRVLFFFISDVSPCVRLLTRSLIFFVLFLGALHPALWLPFVDTERCPVRYDHRSVRPPPLPWLR
ncbi:hypothetical protein L227DRAFT_69716 [Lentinus tigrinus ALCF2SS1-6]|uniref:Uncharacterized protein n=1 Tax=Lentinus tigrinus ALCF2SS1-6 TaxID=1328759 RepID=A0A5C2SDX2_9APHY|nr:hypothetical protein L227DRAFT_69716 [Lentinus tigrinus ALCF2SS1-6]